MRLKYLIIPLFLFIVFCFNTNAQITGTKTIPGDYASIAAAVTDLNSSGVGVGGVTFNVAADYTESITVPILLTATGTSFNTIVFQKSGAGANPKVTRTDAGSNTTGTLGGQGDGVIIIQGSDYVTLDGISLAASNQGIEYGYYLRKASGTDGCKYVTIKNCVIDLTKGTSQYVAGIYSSNNDATSIVSSATGITITSEGGRHENITITGNTVQDVFAGILLRGYNHTTPYNFYDQNFIVGENGAGNAVQNFAGNAAQTSYGVYLIYHNNANISYNTINNTAGGGSNFTSTGYGIFHSDATNGNGTYNNNIINLSSNTGQLKGIMSGTAGIAMLTANNNTITLSQAGTSEASCIHFQSLSASSTITINNNTFSYGTFASTSTSYLINSSNAASNITVSGNQTSGIITKTGASAFYGFYNNGSPSGGSALVQNNIFTNITLTGASPFYGIYYTGSTSQPKTISGNTISNVTGGSSSMYGIFTNNDGAGTQIYSNIVTNISGTGAAVFGYKVGGTSSTTFECFSNQSSNISCSGASAIYGMELLGASTSDYKCYSNNIYNISGTNASSTAYGINILSGGFSALTNIYNNFISDIKAPSSSNAQAVYGINVPGTNTTRLFFNTIYLNASSSGTNFGSNGIYYTTTGNLDMRNNIIINVSTPKGTGSTVAFRMSNNSLTRYQTTSNNNCFYAGPPRPNKLILLHNLNSYQTIQDFKTFVQATTTGRELASFTENVPFVNKTTPPYDLHFKTDVPTLIESGGIAVLSPIIITTDYDGNTRNATTPDVGADEFTGIVNTDPIPPVISYTPLGAGGIASSRNFPGVSITDIQSGVNTTSGTAPRVYFKKSTDTNTFNDNTSATNGWKWVEATGTGPFSFLIDYTLLNASSVSGGDIIQYFVVAQDLYSLPNVAINSGTFEEQPLSVNLIAGNFPILGTINSYSIFGPLSGTIFVGTGQTYTSLTAVDGLFNKLNTSIIAGDITIRITSNITETGAVALNQTNEEANYSINIQPDNASLKTISGNYNGGLIRLNGADNVTIDGRFGGSGNYLSFANDNDGVSDNIAVIQIISLGTNAGATNTTIRNCNVSAGFNVSNGFTSYAISSGGSSLHTAGDDNDNLTIENNVIRKSIYGIDVNGKATGVANNVTITGNTIGSATPSEYVGQYGINISQADGVNISGNTIFNIISANNNLYYGISLFTEVTNAVISGNKIHSLAYTGISGFGATGIAISTGVTSNNILVKNNLIYDISSDGGSYSFALEYNPHGIFLSGNQSGIKIYNNSINLYGNTLNNGDAISIGIGLGTGSSADIKNNIIVNNLGLLGGNGYGSVGIFLQGDSGQLEASSNNLIFVNPSGSGVKNIGQIYTTGYSTLQAWRTATGKDIYSYSGDPAFTSNTNLLPDNTNPNCWAVNNKGMPLAIVPTDFNGNPRSTTVAGGPVDIGAYEFSTATPSPAAIQSGIIGIDPTTTYNVFEFESASITWIGSGLPSDISFRFYSGIEPPGANNNTSKCYWDITQTGGSSFSYDITCNYDPAQIGVITSESDIRLAKSNDNGLSWTPFLDPGTAPNQYQLNTTDNTIKVHGLNSFSLFGLTDVDGALPVELNSFSAAVSGRDVVLKWDTKTEVSSYAFEVERASSSTTPLQGWEMIGSVEASGNSNSPKYYSFTDNSLNSGKYNYRLKMVDNDGSYEYSSEVESEIDVPKEYLLTQNYPNPFNPTTKIDYQLPSESNVTIELYNIAGERVATLLNQEQAPGYYSVEVNSTQFRLSSGVYIYRMTAVSNKDSKSYTQLKKMVLLK